MFKFKRKKCAAVACAVGVLGFDIAGAAAKIPGAIHCFNEICHRVRTVVETQSRVGVVEPLVASFYDAPERDRFNPRLETSSGERFEADADDNAASPIHPDGTILLIWSPVTRGAAVVRINNAGPYFAGRTLDVSHGVAQRLGFGGGGVMQLLSVVIAAPSVPDAHYVRGRVYPKVPGYLGKFESIELASLEGPVARTAAGGVSPLPALAFGSTAQMVIGTAERQFRLSELARTFETVPTETMAAAVSSMTTASLPARVAAEPERRPTVKPQGPLRPKANRRTEATLVMPAAEPLDTWRARVFGDNK